MASSESRYELVFKKSVAKDLRSLPKLGVKRILERIASLAVGPRPDGCEKLTSAERLRIRQGVYRIVYEIQDRRLLVLMVKIAHQRGVYSQR